MEKVYIGRSARPKHIRNLQMRDGPHLCLNSTTFLTDMTLVGPGR